MNAWRASEERRLNQEMGESFRALELSGMRSELLYNNDGIVVPVTFRLTEDGWNMVVQAPDWLLRVVFGSVGAGFTAREASRFFQDGKYRSITLTVSVDR